MPHLHSVNRALLLMLLAWAGVALVLVGYWGLNWERRLETRTARLAMQCAGLLAPADGVEFVELRAHKSDFGTPVVAETPHSGAIAPCAVRASSPLVFMRAPRRGLVSVIIPTHNRAAIIGRAIESALDQTWKDLEVVVADDGSTDDTRAVVERYGPRVIYARQANAGVSAARNFGMRHANGEFIAFLDSDDAWRPWKIEAQMNALARVPNAGLVWTDMSAVDARDEVIRDRYLRSMYSAYDKVQLDRTLSRICTLGSVSPRVPVDVGAAMVRAGDVSSAILLGNMIHTSTVLFRRSWCERTGGFDETYARAGEDYEFYIRLTSAGPAIFIDAPSTLYRVGAADQLTAPAMLLEIARNNLRAVQKWLPRSGADVALSRREIRQRFAESYAWLGEVELDAGHRWKAARRLSQSLRNAPGLDRRAVLLASCALPQPMRSGIRAARARFRHSLAGRSGSAA
jgi:GT2 family glycosyltransferase